MHDAGIFLSLPEQPVVRSDIARLANVRNKTRAPTGVDETVFIPEDVVRVIRNGAADIINIKLGKSGLLGTAGIAAIVWAAGHDLMVGCMLESSVGIHTNAHLALGIDRFSYIDPDTTRLLDDDVIDRESGPTIASSGPGHGIIPNW